MNDEGTLKRSVGGWVIVGVFAALFAHDVWEGIGNVSGMLQIGFELGLQPRWFGWLILGADLLAPIVLFALAFVLTRRRSLWHSLLVWLLALLVSAIIGADIVLAGSNFSLIFPVD